jgi:hypothetical protein
MARSVHATVLVTPRPSWLHDRNVRADLEAAVEQVRYNARGRPLFANELGDEIGDVNGLLAVLSGQAARYPVMTQLEDCP